jgi:hypothetical protein
VTTRPEPVVHCLRSKDGGQWTPLTVGAHSLVGHHLLTYAPGAIYDDGYGNRYIIDSEWRDD